MWIAAARLEHIAADLRYAVRRLAGSPGFSLAAIVSLGLGIGANVAIFTLTYQVLLRPLPYRDPSQLVAVWGDASNRGAGRSNVSPPDYRDWQRDATTVTAFAAYLDDFAVTAQGMDGRAEWLDVRMVSASFFDVLGVAPAVGRTFRGEDDVLGSAAVAVISHGYWQRRFGGRPDVAGAILESEAGRLRVVGVMPRGFAFGAANTDAWLTLRSALSQRDWDNRTNYVLEVVARLKRGVTLDQARGEIDSLARRLTATLPAGERRGAVVLPLREEFAGSVRSGYVALFAAAGCVLVVACLNLAHLLLLRGTRRHHELAVRASLGASRTRLVQQLLAESALLTVGASAIGLVLHSWTNGYFARFVPARMAGTTDLGVSTPVIAFTAVIAAATVGVAGLMPALRLSSRRLLPALHMRDRSAVRSGSKFRSGLVCCQVAFAVLLLVCTSLLVSTMWRLYAVDAGFNPRGLLVVTFPPRPADSVEPLLERVTAIPGVVSAGVATVRPLDAFPGRVSWTIDGQAAGDASAEPRALLRTASAGYFETLEVPLLRGRTFDAGDKGGATPVAIINDSMRRRHWGGGDPIGARIRRGTGAGATWHTIVGVVGDVKQRALDADAEPEVVLPYVQYDGPNLYRPRTLVLRTRSSPAALADVVRREIGAVNVVEPLPDVATMDQFISAGLDDRQRRTVLFSAFALLALILAILGVYAVVSSTVTDRTQEIGVRIALGAGPASVLRMVVGQGIALAAVGCAAGLLGALAVTRTLEGFLFGVTSLDPASFAAAAMLMVSIAGLASYIPARRTTRINVRSALYYE
jgi:putative ABC transport system permease protein